MLAKSLKLGGSPLLILTGTLLGGKDGETAFSKRTQRMISDRKESRKLPKAYLAPKARCKREAEDDAVTHVEVSNVVVVKGETADVSVRGSKLWYGSRETYLNSGDLLASLKRKVG
jgi:hypothetical protein